MCERILNIEVTGISVAHDRAVSVQASITKYNRIAGESTEKGIVNLGFAIRINGTGVDVAQKKGTRHIDWEDLRKPITIRRQVQRGNYTVLVK